MFSGIGKRTVCPRVPRVPCVTPAGPKPLGLKLNVSWALAGNVIYAACQWGMLVVLAKLGSPEMVGRFALALAVTAPVFMLTNLQLRAVQATDVMGRYAFGDYLALRLLATALAMAVMLGLVVLSGYPFETAVVVFVIGLAKAFESISDAIYGLVQRHERMDLISRSMILKGSASIGIFGTVVALTGSLAWAAAGLACAWCLVLVTYDLGLVRRFAPSSRIGASPQWSLSTSFRLAKLSLPLGLTMLFISLNANVPRYFIEHHAGTRALGFFAAVAYLMVAGSLVVNALGQTAAPRLARYYAAVDTRAFRALLLKLCGVAGIVGAGGVLVAAVVGKQVLRLLYRADYASYSDVFTYLMIAAGIGHVASIVGYGMTAARLFKPQVPLFSIVLLISLIASLRLIPVYGLRGAAAALILASIAQLFGSLVVLLAAFRGTGRRICHEWSTCAGRVTGETASLLSKTEQGCDAATQTTARP
jgi:O-antigen/teichoic acid export membrane protein